MGHGSAPGVGLCTLISYDVMSSVTRFALNLGWYMLAI